MRVPRHAPHSLQRLPAPPNILFIMLDDMGPADPGCYGSTSVLTPNFDHLAAEGIRFTQAYAGAAASAPPRAAPS